MDNTWIYKPGDKYKEYTIPNGIEIKITFDSYCGKLKLDSYINGVYFKTVPVSQTVEESRTGLPEEKLSIEEMIDTAFDQFFHFTLKKYNISVDS